MRLTGIKSNELRVVSGRASDDSATSWFQFDIIDKSADRNIFQRKSVARSNRGFFRSHKYRPDRYTFWQKNVTSFTILVHYSADKTGSVWIVLDSFKSGRNIHLLIAKIYISIEPLATTTLVTH